MGESAISILLKPAFFLLTTHTYIISSIETSACSRMDFSVPNLSILPLCIGTETLQFFEGCLRIKWLPF